MEPGLSVLQSPAVRNRSNLCEVHLRGLVFAVAGTGLGSDGQQDGASIEALMHNGLACTDPPLRFLIGGDQRLAQGQAAVVGGHLAVHQYGETVLLQAGGSLFEQEHILPYTAAEHNLMQTMLPA